MCSSLNWRGPCEGFGDPGSLGIGISVTVIYICNNTCYCVGMVCVTSLHIKVDP